MQGAQAIAFLLFEPPVQVAQLWLSVCLFVYSAVLLHCISSAGPTGPVCATIFTSINIGHFTPE